MEEGGWTICGSSAGSTGSGAASPLVSEMRSLLTCGHHLSPETRKLIEMAIECQQGKPLDVSKLLPNGQS